MPANSITTARDAVSYYALSLEIVASIVHLAAYPVHQFNKHSRMEMALVAVSNEKLYQVMR